MKKSDPKLILNLALESQELDEKIQIAMDKYTDDIIEKDLDAKIQKIVTKRINELLTANRWSNGSKIGGVTFEDFVKQKTEDKISEILDKNIKELFAKKVAEML